MRCQSGCQQKQVVTEQKAGMEMPMQSCHTTMYVFGFLVMIGLVTQIFLQSKIIKELRKANKKR